MILIKITILSLYCHFTFPKIVCKNAVYLQLQHNYVNTFWQSVRERMVFHYTLCFSYYGGGSSLVCKVSLICISFLWIVCYILYFSAGMLAFFYRLVGIPNLLRISAICQWYELQVLLPVCHLFFIFAYDICCCCLFLFGALWKHVVLVGWTVNILYVDFKVKSTSALRISVEQ